MTSISSLADSDGPHWDSMSIRTIHSRDSREAETVDSEAREVLKVHVSAFR